MRKDKSWRSDGQKLWLQIFLPTRDSTVAQITEKFNEGEGRHFEIESFLMLQLQ